MVLESSIGYAVQRPVCNIIIIIIIIIMFVFFLLLLLLSLYVYMHILSINIHAAERHWPDLSRFVAVRAGHSHLVTGSPIPNRSERRLRATGSSI